MAYTVIRRVTRQGNFIVGLVFENGSLPVPENLDKYSEGCHHRKGMNRRGWKCADERECQELAVTAKASSNFTASKPANCLQRLLFYQQRSKHYGFAQMTRFDFLGVN